MNKIKFLKVNAALLATLMLSGSSLSLAHTTKKQIIEDDNINYEYRVDPNRETRIERFILTEEEQQDPNYSYIIRDKNEDLLTTEGVEIYNKIIKSILNHEETIYIEGDKTAKMEACKAVLTSPYNMLLEHEGILYVPNESKVTINYSYSKEEQDEKMLYVQNKIIEIKKELFKEDMNKMDKVLVLFNYAVKNFNYQSIYPRPENFDKSYQKKNIDLDLLFQNNEGICHTFSFFLDTFCQEEGMESYLLKGYIKGVYHMWNMIKLDDDKFYMFDISETILKGKNANDNFCLFGITSDEYSKYEYEIPSEEKILTVDMKCYGLKKIRFYKDYEYLGNHIFKLTGANNRLMYYNTETRECYQEELKSPKKN